MKATILCIALLFLAAQAREVTVTCVDDSSCSSGKAYSFAADGVDSDTDCADPACYDGLDLTIDAIECETDYSGADCATGVCIVPTDMDVCSSTTACSTDL